MRMGSTLVQPSPMVSSADWPTGSVLVLLGWTAAFSAVVLGLAVVGVIPALPPELINVLG